MGFPSSDFPSLHFAYSDWDLVQLWYFFLPLDLITWHLCLWVIKTAVLKTSNSCPSVSLWIHLLLCVLFASILFPAWGCRQSKEFGEFLSIFLFFSYTNIKEAKLCFFFLNVCVCVCVCACARTCLVTQSRPTLCNTMDHSPPASSVHGILQARILEWIAFPFSRGSSQPRNWTRVSCIAGGFFTIWVTREAPMWMSICLKIVFKAKNNLSFRLSSKQCKELEKWGAEECSEHNSLWSKILPHHWVSPSLN